MEVVLKSRAADQVPSSPQDPQWAQTQAQEVPLMPQRLVTPGGGAARTLKVRALHDPSRLALLLEWQDPRPDELPSAAEAFSDACAVQLPARLGTMPSPFMGDPRHPVVIWRWSAGAQKDIEEGRQPRTKARPHMAPEPHPVYEREAEVLAGERAGNVLSRRNRKSPVEFLGAMGYGTLTAFQEEPVRGKGVWKDGFWRVVLSRDLKGDPELAPGSRSPIAFALWDGGSRERNGMKSVSVWHSLALGYRPGPPSEPVARGQRVFERYGCASCHGRGGIGGVTNANSQGGLVPPINKVKEGFTEDEVKKVIRDGRTSEPEDSRGPAPPLHMNAWKAVMDEGELDDLVKYLFSLLPAKKSGEEW